MTQLPPWTKEANVKRKRSSGLCEKRASLLRLGSAIKLTLRAYDQEATKCRKWVRGQEIVKSLLQPAYAAALSLPEGMH